jgi:hypothetical protein
MADDTEAPVEGVNQTTISNAGLDPFSREIQRIEGRRQAMLDTSSALSNQRSAAFSGMEDLTRQKNAAGAPVRDRLQTLASNVPSSKVDLERSPDFQAPMADPKEMQQSFGILMAASMLVGAASRSPFYGAMQAMGGAMQGWQQQDERMFKDSLAKFQVNLAAIKERNQAKREEVDSAVKDYSNNIAGLKAQLEVIAQKYDDQIGLATLRTKSIGEAQKVLENNIEKENQAVERLLRDQANMKASEARLAEANARRKEAGALSREREDRLKAEADARAARRKETDDAGERATGRALDVITEMENLLKSNTGITGLPGSARRIAESVGGTVGLTEEGSAHQYESLARELQNILRQTETFRYKGRTLAKEVADRDVMVRGLKFGDTGQVSLDQLQHLRNMLTGEGAGYERPGMPKEPPAGRLFAKNPTTGARVFSDDGGKSWQPVQ